MSLIPAYQAAAVAQPAQAGHANQFLASHNAQFIYAGALQSSQTTGTGVYSDTLTQWLTQRITTGVSQTAIGSLQLQISAVGGSPTLNVIPPLQVSLYADAGGFPSGAALASVSLAGTYVYGAPFWMVVPLAAIGLTASTPYHVATALVGTTGHYFVWQRSNAGTGAATSPDGVTWTNQAYGLMYQVFDQSGSGLLQMISDDGGARLTTFTYDALNRISQVTEYAAQQGGGGFIQSSGTLSYSNGLMTGVS